MSVHDWQATWCNHSLSTHTISRRISVAIPLIESAKVLDNKQPVVQVANTIGFVWEYGSEVGT